ncbi:hypothetical protein BH09PAT2_BH09PAT2_08480 [soil metagenome]
MVRNLTTGEIENILNPDLDKPFWLYQLGVIYSNEDDGFNNLFLFPFDKKGKQIWESYIDKLREVICIVNEGKPKHFYTSTETQTIAAIISAIVSSLGVEYSVAIILYSLCLRETIEGFCAP